MPWATQPLGAARVAQMILLSLRSSCMKRPILLEQQLVGTKLESSCFVSCTSLRDFVIQNLSQLS
jgi:hypothetical protein